MQKIGEEMTIDYNDPAQFDSETGDYILYVLVVCEAGSLLQQGPTEGTLTIGLTEPESEISPFLLMGFVVISIFVCVPLITISYLCIIRRRATLQKKVPVWVMPEATEPDYSTNQDLLRNNNTTSNVIVD